MNTFFSRIFTAVFDNSLDAFVPEVWAQESLIILESNLVAANAVHRDFENEIAQFGDVVNTRQPATFTAARKLDSDSVTVQNATATNVPVKLNQHFHTSFMIKDGEESKGFENLRTTYLIPAIQSIAEALEQVVIAQKYAFMANVVGKLGTTPTRATVSAAQAKLNSLKAPQADRTFIISSDTQAALLNVDDFVQADKLGDDGTAMREGSLGHKFGFDIFMSQNCPKITYSGTTYATGLINNTGGYAAGTTSIVVDAFTTEYANYVGGYCTIAGDMTPQKIISATDGTETIVISPGLKYAVADDAVLTAYLPETIDGEHAADYAKGLVVDGSPTAQVGQLVSAAGASSAVYGAIGGTGASAIYLDRPLDATIANDTDLGLGPSGDYNWAFHKNAVALVTRPLAAPAEGTGALSFVAEYNGLAIRVTITYNGSSQGHLVTCDLLCGIKVLNTSLGCIVYG
jgi:hypothetical protein